MQQESYRHPPYTTNWLKYGNDVYRMTTIHADDFVLIIKALARSTRDYAFPICEFQAINPRYNANTLCLPDMGLSIYQATGQGLLRILRKILPLTTEIKYQIDAVNAGDGNGYTLLWNIGMRVIPIFNQRITIPEVA